MRSSLNVGKDLVLELQKTGNPQLLLELFETRTREWKVAFVYDEGGTIGVFDDLQLDSGLGFKLIPITVDILLNQMKPDRFLAALSLLYICVCQSNTTEIPQGLIERWDEIEEKIKVSGDKESALLWDEISRWYRMDCKK